MYAYPQIILNKSGNSYYGTAHILGIYTNDVFQNTLKDILTTESFNRNRYFIYEIGADIPILRAAQSNIEGAIQCFNAGDNQNRVIVHFGPNLLAIPNK